ncbi:MAG: hypothetical protein ACT4QD_10250 [Acidobacteriota bacterium]
MPAEGFSITEQERVARLLAAASPTRSPDRVKWIWLVYVALYALSIPWYWPAGPGRAWLGLPHWVVVSLAASIGVAAFTWWVARRLWAAEEPEREEGLAGEGDR